MSTLDNLRKSARRWLKALRSADPDARARLARVYPDAPEPPTLRAVQQALARERGHESWIALTRAAQAEVASDSALTSLLDSAGKGDAARVAAILDLHPDLVNQRGLLDGHTGLRTALHFGIAHELVVRTLLQRGADPNVRDEGDHAYPLHFAAERGDLTIVTLLIEHGADPVGAVTTHELDVLGWAVCFDSAPHLDVARYLLAHGATHTLLSATAMGVVEAIRALAAAGADLNQRMDRTNHRRTPLHLAVIKKQPTALSALLALGADTRLEDAAGLTAFDHAAINADDEMTRLLIDAGAPMTLLAAIALDRADDIERLVREHPDALSMTSRERWGQMLVQASRRAPGHVIDLLLRTLTRYRAGLSVVNVADDEETAVDGASGYTPLHAAAFHGNDSAVDVLLAHGANPRRRDGKYCGTPAGWAAHAGHARTAARILEADVDIFDAIDFDRADRVMDILARDPGAGERPFKAYASCGSREGQWWPPPDCTPLEWATSREKQNALDVLTARASQWTPDNLSRAERITSFLQSACWDHQVHGRLSHRMHDMAAQRLLAADPSIADDSIYTAVVCGRRDRVAEIVATRPDAARLRGGPREWTPILYLAYTRFTHADVHAHAVEIARLLLDHGADPHDFYMAMDARYSVLTGVAGEGEQDAPRQPYAAALFDLLLERDAEAFDIQVLYNTHFSGDMQWWLDLVYTRTIDTPRGAAWRDPEWMMFDMGAYGSGARFILETAIKKGHPSLVAWALERGANPNAAPARDQRFAQRSLYELALTEGHRDIAELIARYGGARTTPRLDDREQFMQACERLDRDGAARLARAHPEYLRTHDFLFDAARRDRADTLALLIELGTSGDVEDTTGKRALHEAAFHDARQAAAWLIGRGAEIDPRERTYGGTPISWAAHGDKTAMVHLLATHSRDVRTLCAMGCVDRVRQLVAEEPALA
ncbi:MAG: ankyrin repeat domain-containing protein, partial [Acidobacteria bacterium]|nr:ankyrin repeat domain-containing protein [Acidobacteriota bacterium]